MVPAESALVALQQVQAASAMFPQLGAVMLPQLSALGLMPRASSGQAAHLAVPRAAAQSFPEQLPLVATRPLQTPLANPIANLLPEHPAMMPGTAGGQDSSCLPQVFPKGPPALAASFRLIMTMTSGAHRHQVQGCAGCACPDHGRQDWHGVSGDLNVSPCKVQSEVSIRAWLNNIINAEVCMPAGMSLAGTLHGHACLQGQAWQVNCLQQILF